MIPEILKQDLEKELAKQDNKLGNQLLEYWDDMTALAKDDSVSRKLWFLDDEIFPEVYFAYTLLLSGEKESAVYGCEVNPYELLEEVLALDVPIRPALYEVARLMIREKYRRQHRYEL